MQQGISSYIHVTIIFLASTADQQGRKITHKKRLMHFYDRLIRHTVRNHLLTITGQKGMSPAWTCQYLFSGVLYPWIIPLILLTHFTTVHFAPITGVWQFFRPVIQSFKRQLVALKTFYFMWNWRALCILKARSSIGLEIIYPSKCSYHLVVIFQMC